MSHLFCNSIVVGVLYKLCMNPCMPHNFQNNDWTNIFTIGINFDHISVTIAIHACWSLHLIDTSRVHIIICSPVHIRKSLPRTTKIIPKNYLLSPHNCKLYSICSYSVKDKLLPIHHPTLPSHLGCSVSLTLGYSLKNTLAVRQLGRVMGGCDKLRIL
jgi:hypothetical protein